MGGGNKCRDGHGWNAFGLRSIVLRLTRGCKYGQHLINSTTNNREDMDNHKKNYKIFRSTLLILHLSVHMQREEVGGRDQK